MLSLEHKKLRQKGLGGSDIGTLMGVNPYKTLYALWLDKTQPILEEDEPINEKIRWGNLLEPVILKRYMEVQREKNDPYQDYRLDEDWKNDTVITHPKFPYLLASPDALFLNRENNYSSVVATSSRNVAYSHGLEIKTTGAWNAKLWGNDINKKIPISYYYQIIHYMLVTGLERWDVAVLIGGNDFRTYTFHKDMKVENEILKLSHKFWNEYVIPNVEPPEKLCLEEENLSFL